MQRAECLSVHKGVETHSRKQQTISFTACLIICNVATCFEATEPGSRVPIKSLDTLSDSTEWEDVSKIQLVLYEISIDLYQI